MTPEAQWKAVAAALGWTDLWLAPVGDLRAEPELLGRQKPSDSYWPVPDYLGDLNRSWDFEGIIEKKKRTDRFLRELSGITTDKACWKISEANHWACATATAAQRAEAFLRAMDLWVYPKERA